MEIGGLQHDVRRRPVGPALHWLTVLDVGWCPKRVLRRAVGNLAFAPAGAAFGCVATS